MTGRAVGRAERSSGDRRQAPRFLVSLGAEVRLDDRRILGSISELSRAGAFLDLCWDEEIEPEGNALLACPAFGDPIEVTIRSTRVASDGAVRGLGVEFVRLTAEAAARLGRYVGLLAK
jgi:hypothetical protein